MAAKPIMGIIYLTIFIALTIVILLFIVGYLGGSISLLGFNEYSNAIGMSFFICATIYTAQLFMCFLYKLIKGYNTTDKE